MTFDPREPRIARMKAAGYSHYLEYQLYLAVADCWTETGFPTTPDALDFWKEKLEAKQAEGLISDLHIHPL